MKFSIKNTIYAIPLSLSAVAMMAVPTLSAQAAVPTDKSLAQLVEVIELDKTLEQMNSIDGMQKRVTEAMLPIFVTKDMSDSQSQQRVNAVSKYVKNIFNEEYISNINSAYKNAYIDAAKKHFTQKEINAQIAFYGTEIGASIAEKQPAMTQDYADKVLVTSTQLMSKEMQKAIPILIQEFRDLELKK